MSWFGFSLGSRCAQQVAASLLVLGVSASNILAENWPTFRGADRTSVAKGQYLTEWPAGGPKLLWQTKGAGRGYASLAIVDGKIYTLGDNLSTAGNDKDEYLTCFDASGKPLWKSKTGPAWNEGSPDWQGSRSTPTVDGGLVYVITPHGVLVACDAATGAEKWRKDLKKEFGGKKADSWGYSESPLLDGENLICTPGGTENTMVALNKKTGELVWKSARPEDIGAGHSSIVISTVGGTKVYVQTTGSGALGVSAKTGKLLWSYPIAKTTAVIPTPIVKGDYVFFSAGYGRGGALLQQVGSGESITMKEIYGLNKELGNKHGGVVLIGDYLYGDSDDQGMPFCAEFMTGKQVWKSRGSGSRSAVVIGGGDRIYVRFQNGVLALAEATPKGYEEKGSFQIPGSEGSPSWSHPVILDGKLYLREGDAILCYDISKK